MIAAAVEYGFLPDIKQPRSNKFKHSIVGTCGGKDTLNQSNGNWLSFSNLPAGWQSTGDLFKPKEIIFPESYEQIVCCVLNRRGVGVGRSGHSIMYGEYDPDEDAMLYPDSYNLIRVDSRRMINSAVGGAYCIASMTQPDNWNDLAN
jgi:hypothetical protein